MAEIIGMKEDADFLLFYNDLGVQIRCTENELLCMSATEVRIRDHLISKLMTLRTIHKAATELMDI